MTGSAESMFFARIGEVLTDIESLYDVVIIKPPATGLFDDVGTLCRDIGSHYRSPTNARCDVDEPISGDD